MSVTRSTSARLASALRTSPATPSTSSTARYFSSSFSSRDADSTASTSSSTPSETVETAGSPLDALPSDDRTPSSSGKAGNGFRAWLKGDGAQYRHPQKGRTNWIGDTPFPMNPTFNPLPPLSDITKTRIYNSYTHNLLSTPNATDSLVVRAVALKFGVAMDRVRAIVRLKELEKEWVKEGKVLQTNLVEGMESALGVTKPRENWKGVEGLEGEKPTLGKSKTVFEMVDVESGDSPVFLPLLARASAKSSASSSGSTTTAASTKSRVRSAIKTTVPASRPGRAATVFRDVSGTPAGEAYAATRTPKAKRGNRRRPVSEGEVDAKQ